MKATAIFVQGPEPDINRDGDEIPKWYVFAGDDDGEAVGKTYECGSRQKAIDLAERMADDRRLPIEDESSDA